MNEDNNKYIPKLSADVKMLTENSQLTSNYTIFLKIKKDSKKVENLKDFLQYENRLFLPVFNNNNKTFELMNITNIIYIKETQETLAKAGKTVTLTLTNKTRLKVKISSNSLVDRISDFINSKDNFLEFISEDNFNIHINKYKISMLQEKNVY